jgi:2-polyprenyl-6-methoxyphenol hydroxylase-like FAD-dependent oxidoreductase
MEADSFYAGRVALCGDAAHVLSPIGGQGMNVGWGDAALLAEILGKERNIEHGFRVYERVRRRVFRQAARRAAWGMGLGVWSGGVGSRVRKSLVKTWLGHNRTAGYLAEWFMMRNLAGHDGVRE